MNSLVYDSNEFYESDDVVDLELVEDDEDVGGIVGSVSGN